MFNLKKNELLDSIKELVFKNPEKNPLYENLNFHQNFLQEDISEDNLYDIKFNSLATELKFKNDFETGKFLNYEEVSLENLSDEEFEKQSASNSLSLKRIPSLENSVKGNLANFPFKPANLKSKLNYFLDNKDDYVTTFDDESDEFIDFDNLLIKPDNFDTGLFHNEIPNNLKKNYSYSENINDELLNDIFLCINEFKQNDLDAIDEEEKIESNNEKNEGKEVCEKAPVINVSVKDIKETNYFDTKFVKILDSSEPLDDLDNLIPNPAKNFPFKLDTFQKKAILCLEQKKNILVAAHTSAGKTVVAEYAISLSLRNLTKAIYTSPIKALSNQKYRDFRKIYGSENVGLITGDIQLNQEASCLIMTTEILLQMLYNGSELIRDLEWIVFDEVHYINNKERGHIWEEIFILLPDHISLVLLSATVSNISDFGDWLGRVRNKITYIVFTKKRPVPLEHYLYLGSDGITEKFFKIINHLEQFSNIEYNKAVDFYRQRELKRTSGTQRNKLKSDKSGSKVKTLKNKNSNNSMIDPTEKNMYIALIRNLKKNDKLPLIVFMFSRQKCNASASLYWKSIDLCKPRQKTRIHIFIKHSLQKLKKSDRELPQIVEMSSMLKNGIGVHHSGILPLLREITEILFQQGLIKVLFTTETFSMGINMPAKSVLFDSILKHDGLKKRELLSSEYIQMAGRAGRRGLDETGTVIIFCKNSVPPFSSLASSISNKVSPLESKFKLTYSMILNILRVRHHLRIENIIEKSFVEHRIQSNFNSWLQEKTSLQEKLKTMNVLDCSICMLDIDSFSFEYLYYLDQRKYVMKQFCSKSLSQRKLIENGSILIYGSVKNPFFVGVVLKIKMSVTVSNSEILIIGFNFFDLICHIGNIKKISGEIRWITLDEIDNITKLICRDVKVPENESLESEEAANICMLLYEKLIESNQEITIDTLVSLFLVPSYSPNKNLKMNEMEYIIEYDKFVNKRMALLQKKCFTCKKFYSHLKFSIEKMILKNTLTEINQNLSYENLKFLPDYRRKIDVLRDLGCINDENLLTLKGKVAGIICDYELLITELLVDNFFNNLEVEEIAALISCFTYQNRNTEVITLDQFLQSKIIDIQKTSKRIDLIEEKHGLSKSSDEIIDSLNFSLVPVIYEWAKGKSFIHVMSLTSIQEGIVVRCIQRTDELLKNLTLAAKLVGDFELSNKIIEASKCIRRDIVFSISLYVQE